MTADCILSKPDRQTSISSQMAQLTEYNLVTVYRICDILHMPIYKVQLKEGINYFVGEGP